MKKNHFWIKKLTMMFGLVALLMLASGCNASAATMTKAEKAQFSSYLKRGMGHDGYSTTFQTLKSGRMYSPKFFVYDVNGDGHKDVIVTGAVGLRSATFSEVYMHVGKKYVAVPISGTPKAVSSKGIYSVLDDYSMAGAIRYHTCYACVVNRSGKITTENSYNTTKMFYDVATGKNYKNGKLIQKEYLNVKGKKISKSAYDKSVKQVNKKKVKMYKLTSANIKKYLK